MNRLDRISLTFLLAIASLTALSCEDDTDDNAMGTLQVELWGEAYIEDKIPAGDLVDGFEVDYTRFLINLESYTVAQDGAESAIEETTAEVWDLSQPGPVALTSAEVATGNYTHTAYTIAPADANSTAGNATSDALTLMQENGYSIYVEATVSDGTTTKEIAWGFANTTVYDPCESGGAVTEDDSATIQLTIHGDHLFYDSAVSDDPALRFASIAAADADADGRVTQQELLAYDIQALSNYAVGSMDITNMWDYIEHMTTTLGHIDGEGHCHISE